VIFRSPATRGFERGSPARGEQARQARVAELGKFIEAAQQRLGVPGVALGLVQDGKVVFSGGFGTRTLGAKAPVNGDTLFMIASNTKAMTTLMLAKLVDEHKLTWDTQVTTLLPSFKLGSADTTSRVLVKHLICACTGMPRQGFSGCSSSGRHARARSRAQDVRADQQVLATV
jgi:CubicO group peptidase (beta-lactamase class C family)